MQKLELSLVYNPLFLLILISLFSCGKEEVPPVVVNSEAVFAIEASNIVGLTHHYFMRNVPVYYEQNIGSITTAAESVIAKPYKSSISGSFSDIDFGFLRDIKVYARSIQNPEQFVMMYYLDNIGYNVGNEFSLFATLNNANFILKEDIIDLEVVINLKESVPFTFNSRLKFSYSLE